jgi:hypothetical protein
MSTLIFSHYTLIVSQIIPKEEDNNYIDILELRDFDINMIPGSYTPWTTLLQDQAQQIQQAKRNRNNL